MRNLWNRFIAWLTGPRAEVGNAVDLERAEPTPVASKPSIAPHTAWGAPWVLVDIELLGKYENDPALAKALVPEWQLEGYEKKYDSLIGKSRAWCMLRVNHALRKIGLKPAKNAGAKHASEIGKKCPFWFGAILPIKHVATGGRHVAIFLYWINKDKALAATLDGNKGNRFAVNETDLSLRSGADELVDGPRWPAGRLDGQLVSMEEVLARYPMFKVSGKAGGSTQ